MSEDGLSESFEEPNMEIQIKTLLGTTFDIKVSSIDTIEDIKKKICRIEGIPIHQQNLIYQSNEMKDSSRLGDAGIKNGSILTLVTSMRGGPISTRRLSVTCEHHVMLKELKELLENTREEISPGSKVSVLIFKEGDVINLLRVIENEDGSYSPYSEKPISPPLKPARKESRISIFERLVEDNEMSNKLANLRKKMEEVHFRKQSHINKISPAQTSENSAVSEESQCSSQNNSLAFSFLTQCGNELLDGVDLKIIEKNFEEENEVEIALKDKHRSNLHRLTKNKIAKSLFSESKGAYSQTKQKYTRIHKKSRESRINREAVTNKEINGEISTSTRDLSSGLSEKFSVLKEEDYSESLSIPAANRIHLTRLVLSETSERPKSSPDSIELEENAQDLWEIHEPSSERLKHSATCKVGLLKRRQSVDFSYEGIESAPKGELSNFSCKNSNLEVCSSNFYCMPMPSAIPPQYAPKEQGDFCDYYFTKQEHSPLYGRCGKSVEPKVKEDSRVLETTKKEKYDFLTECSNIQRLKNDTVECDSLFSLQDQSLDELYGYYNLGCSSDLLGGKVTESARKEENKELPPVIKKKARCSECNKRLNITNIYDCRCGKIFCSQHRYSEVHRCSYDYKLEGRKILEKQNPLVAAEKVNKI